MKILPDNFNLLVLLLLLHLSFQTIPPPVLIQIIVNSLQNLSLFVSFIPSSTNGAPSSVLGFNSQSARLFGRLNVANGFLQRLHLLDPCQESGGVEPLLSDILQVFPFIPNPCSSSAALLRKSVRAGGCSRVGS